MDGLLPSMAMMKVTRDDAIATIYAYEGCQLALDTINDSHNQSRYAEDKHQQQFTAHPGIRLTFSNPPKCGSAFVIGTDPNICDILLPSSNGFQGLSPLHCYITFDSKRNLILCDCSSIGMAVTFKRGEIPQRRRGFTWIIAYNECLYNKTIVIYFGSALKFQVDFTPQARRDNFEDQVDKFMLKKGENFLIHLSSFGIPQRYSTSISRSLQLPGADTIFFREEKLGHGGFADVYRVWDVSTGIVYAQKRFNIRSSVWKWESDLMKNFAHPNIVGFFLGKPLPEPQLILEYIGGGNLRFQHIKKQLRSEEVVIALEQSLNALAYLHGKKPPIVHRDVKPENILVVSRKPMRIKLSDFGLSQAKEYFHTPRGTDTYAAPEIINAWQPNFKGVSRYTHSVDIWSLGVTVLRITCGLPVDRTSVGKMRWCEQLVESVKNIHDSDLRSIVSQMVTLEPTLRVPVKKYLDMAADLRKSNDSRKFEPRQTQMQRPS